MRRERQIFEERIKEFKDGAAKALETVNKTADLFNSYGYPFCIIDKETFSKKCKEGYVKRTLERMINKAASHEAREEKIAQLKHRCGLMEKILTEPANNSREAIKVYGRVIDYNSEKLCFVLNWDKLERAALRYAEYKTGTI